jgi:hypothetical protein
MGWWLAQVEGSFDTVAYAFEKLYDVVKVKGKQKTLRHVMIPSEKVPGIIGKGMLRLWFVLTYWPPCNASGSPQVPKEKRSACCKKFPWLP